VEWVRRIGALAVAGVATAHLLAAQAAFEVASVKPNRSGFPGGDTEFRPGQFIARNQTLRVLIVAAYELEEFRVVGGPDWVSSERFDVQARATSPITRREAMPMLRALLADRFALRVRMERRNHSVYALVLNRPGTFGPRLGRAAASACVERGPQPPRVPPGELPSCGMLPMTTGRLSGRSVGLALLATQISPLVRRVVLDQTAVKGLVDIDLDWEIDEEQRAALARLLPDRPLPPIDPDKPGLIGALQEQLGLRLESKTAPVDVLVVDSAQRPSEN
jgi:uncharacterized protein (TIGR03435 family)